MTRLAFITDDNLSADQQAVWDCVTNGRRGPADRFVNDEGGLIGPFNAPLYAPATGKKVVELGEALRFDTEVDNRLLELAVCTVGAHWRSNFEWFAHSRMAIDAGISAEAVAAIERGDEPSLDRDDERAVYALTSGLLREGRVADDVYDAARKHVGEQGLVELVQPDRLLLPRVVDAEHVPDRAAAGQRTGVALLTGFPGWSQGFGQTRRLRAAQWVSSCRFDSCSLRSTDDAWLSTVRAEMWSSVAISL